MPAATTDADAGTKLVEFDDLPSTWMSAPSNGTISKTGSWPQETAIASGTAQYWRLYNSTGTTCHDQGTVYQTGDSPDPGETMEIRKKSITLGDPIEVVTFSLTMPVN